jgi:hypothetical protein
MSDVRHCLHQSVTEELLYLEFTSLFELRHVALPLERTASGEEDILVVAVDILRPCCEPCHRFVVDDLLPVSRYVWLRDRNAFGNVDSDVLRIDTKLYKPNNNTSAFRRTVRCNMTRLTFSEPFRGCSPRPRNRLGGSTRKLPTFSLRPSKTQAANGPSNSSLAAFASFFSAVVIAFLRALSASKCSYIGRKSQRLRSVILTLFLCQEIRKLL